MVRPESLRARCIAFSKTKNMYGQPDAALCYTGRERARLPVAVLTFRPVPTATPLVILVRRHAQYSTGPTYSIYCHSRGNSGKTACADDGLTSKLTLCGRRWALHPLQNAEYALSTCHFAELVSRVKPALIAVSHCPLSRAVALNCEPFIY